MMNSYRALAHVDEEDTAVTTYGWLTCFQCGEREPSRDLEDVGREPAEVMHLCDECASKGAV